MLLVALFLALMYPLAIRSGRKSVFLRNKSNHVVKAKLVSSKGHEMLPVAIPSGVEVEIGAILPALKYEIWIEDLDLSEKIVSIKILEKFEGSDGFHFEYP